MNKPKFKVGDRVRIISDEGGSLHLGKVGTETTVVKIFDNRIYGSSHEYAVNLPGGGGIREERLQLISEEEELRKIYSQFVDLYKKVYPDALSVTINLTDKGFPLDPFSQQ
jgi:hypothetical protein